ncbi:unnamed protein product [Sphenostylis stenocarpa]|uniref:Uncharacterized protein n=1 Tax=Sphenostylis stenocarpa TaxID=92480 RepID=A0AA86SG90_9FABA|nr:unnamed protein product [Sphenostylis stenocarpa]
MQEYGVWKKMVFDRNSLNCLSSFFAASEITAPWVLFKASKGPKVGLRSGIGITLCSQPLKEEGSLSLIQWMLESEVSRAFR